ncbi:MAG: glycine oxidase ThiO [Sandaracinaceae bacterium]|nr:glycine oxidase ThiO [Sandaracinaceae bacterium]
MASPDIIVIGAGIVGCAIARELQGRGYQVMVLERAQPGAEASSVAAGILAPAVEHASDPILFELGRKSQQIHQSLAEELGNECKVDVGFRRKGALVVFFETNELLSPPEHFDSMGVRVEPCSPQEIQHLEPAVSDQVIGALFFPDESQVEAGCLLQALLASAKKRGVLIRQASVRRLLVQKGKIHGVECELERVYAPHVVIAAGAWSSLIVPDEPALGLPLIRPVRGQLVHARGEIGLVRHIVFGKGVYIVPRDDGRIVCGATVEEAGFDRQPTLGGIAQVMSRALGLIPCLSSTEFFGHGVSFRPATIDGRPLIGPSEIQGLWIASGHYRNGILWSPITAQIIADLIEGRTPSLSPELLAAISPQRPMVKAQIGSSPHS